ncbi:MAG: FlgD immunoglobulin-like domain containing protein [Candidatus Krumholzibacteriia bacterium]
MRTPSRAHPLVILVLVVLPTLAGRPVPAQVRLDRHVVADGGGVCNVRDGHGVALTVGQAMVGPVGGPAFDLEIGFWTPGLGDPTAVLDPDPPFVFGLERNAPNPFNPVTTLAFTLAEPAAVELRVFDLRGGCIRKLVQDTRPAGRHQVTWDGTDDRGCGVASGTYVARLVSADGCCSRKLQLVR